MIHRAMRTEANSDYVVSRREAAIVGGVPQETFGWLQRRGITPSSGNLTLVHVTAVVTAKGLRASGVLQKDAEAVLTMLWDTDEADIREMFDSGQKYLMIVGRRCAPRLVCVEAICDTAAIDTDSAVTAGLLPRGLDVESVYTRICQETESLRRKVL